MARAGGFCADVDNVSAIGNHAKRMANGGFYVDITSTVGEGIGGDVQNPHDVGIGAVKIKGTVVEFHSVSFVLVSDGVVFALGIPVAIWCSCTAIARATFFVGVSKKFAQGCCVKVNARAFFTMTGDGIGDCFD